MDLCRRAALLVRGRVLSRPNEALSSLRPCLGTTIAPGDESIPSDPPSQMVYEAISFPP